MRVLLLRKGRIENLRNDADLRIVREDVWLGTNLLAQSGQSGSRTSSRTSPVGRDSSQGLDSQSTKGISARSGNPIRPLRSYRAPGPPRCSFATPGMGPEYNVVTPAPYYEHAESGAFNRGAKKMRICWGIVFVLVVGAAPMWAALGEPEQSVQQDRARMAGQSKRTEYQSYAVHEITASGGRVIREYVSPSGTVFAVVWEGPTLPDLSSLLGSYAAAFQQASTTSSRRHGPLMMQVGSLVVESGGRMRHFRGRAYVTDLIPANISKDVIR